MTTYLIAEAASTHDGSLSKALRLIRESAAAGANAVKFQWWSDADHLADRRRVPDHYREIYHHYQVPFRWVETLRAECELAHVDFLCTTYLPEDVPIIAPYVKALKIASFEAGDRAFLDANRATGKPLIVSVGMMGHDPLWQLLLSLRDQDTILHCVSAYPCALEMANLSVIQTIRAHRDHDEHVLHARFRAGLSDHTAHWLTGALAVAAGAEVIETHVRLHDTDLQNPDFAPALLVWQDEYGQIGWKTYNNYVEMVRHAERVMGDGRKIDGSQNEVEKEMARYRVTGDQR